jgi:hypothetical protein
MFARGKLDRFWESAKLIKNPIGYFRFCYMKFSLNFMSSIGGLCDMRGEWSITWRSDSVGWKAEFVVACPASLSSLSCNSHDLISQTASDKVDFFNRIDGFRV